MEENELEMAEKFSQSQRDFMIAISRQALQAEHHEDFDGLHCLDCGEGIIKQRLDSGRIRCTDCQSALELKARQYSH